MSIATFDRCLREQAERHGNRVALVDDGVAIAYRELDRLTTAVAGRLVAAGVEVGDRVLLVADNSIGHLVHAFAVWRAGATLVTIYPSSTPAELEQAVRRTEPVLVIAGARITETAQAATGGRTPVVVLAETGELLGLESNESTPSRPLDPDGLALVCFTSGSTAQPKGVMHTHAGLLGAARSYAEVWHLGPDDTTLVVLPLAWAFGLVTASMATLCAGGQVTIAPRAEAREMLRRIAGHRVTFLPAVTTIFHRLVDALGRHERTPDLSSLRLCISGGEPRHEAVFARWELITGCPVHDVYASSECFPVVTYDPVRDPHPRPGAAGRVVAQSELRVVDGEAWTRGPAMTIGYWGDPELTGSVLTPDGWYRTSDLVRIDDDGYVYVVGRLSDLIIRGGANVSPAEVEAVLVAADEVLEAAVVGVADPDHGQEIVAAIVAKPGQVVDDARLRQHCLARLAGYKVPTKVVVVDELPRNANTGKVQRREVVALLGEERR